jgi:inositol monophosphatase 3
MKQAFPGIRIVSEENNSSLTGLDELPIDRLSRVNLPNELAWLPDRSVALTELVVWIDPLDATQEYTEGLLQFVTTMVCVAYKGKPIIGVIHKPFERARSDVRRNKFGRLSKYETYWAWQSVGHSNSVDKLLKKRHHHRNDSSLNVIVSRSHPGQVESDIRTAFGSQFGTHIIQAGGSGYKTIELLKGERLSLTGNGRNCRLASHLLLLFVGHLQVLPTCTCTTL